MAFAACKREPASFVDAYWRQSLVGALSWRERDCRVPPIAGLSTKIDRLIYYGDETESLPRRHINKQRRRNERL